MVDCRPAAGAPPHELAHSAPNGGPPPPSENNHHNQLNQGGAGGDMGAPAPAPAARASTPASTALPHYAVYSPTPTVTAGGMVAGGAGGMSPAMGYAPYYGGGKALGGVLWMPPPMAPPVPPPPPHHVNPHVFKSVQPNGSDLPMNDIPTLRYYFNLGVECLWSMYGQPPPRHYAPRDITQEMQQMSLNERACGGGGGGAGAPPLDRHKGPHAAPDKPPLQGKGNGQRSLLGPRFNKRGNQDGNQNTNHNQNKGHNNNNNNMANKGPNNRRNSHEVRGGAGGAPYAEGGECVVEGGLVPLPYVYPPPVYPMPYYPLDSNDPAMMGMMGGMGYVNYDETGEYVAPYYPPLYPAHPPHPAPHHLPPAPHHAPDHK